MPKPRVIAFILLGAYSFNMKKLIIYHGSEKIVERPTPKGGKPYNDYGYGFYTTTSLDLACEWAVTKDHDGYANRYELDFDGLEALDLCNPKVGVLPWIAILLENRTFPMQTSLQRQAKKYLLDNFLPTAYRNYDVIIGYRADDSYFGYASDFLSGSYSLRQLSEALRLGKLGKQIVLISEKAFSKLRFKEATIAKRSDYLESKMVRDRLARKRFQESKSDQYDPNDIFITDIIRGGYKNGDPRL